MKKRSRGLICCWLVLVMLLGICPAALAVDSYSAYLVTDVDSDGSCTELGKYPLESDTPLDEQEALYDAAEAVRPEGHVLSGWKLWQGHGSGGYLYGIDIDVPAQERAIDGTVDEETYNDFAGRYDKYLCIEPQWLQKYKIDPQPTNDVPTVGVKEYGEDDEWTDITDDPGLRYQWYEEAIVSYYLNDTHTDLISGNEAIYSSDDVWYLNVLFDDSWPVDLSLPQGITVRVEPVGETAISEIVIDGQYFEDKGEYWELTLSKSVETCLEVYYQDDPTQEDGVKIKITESVFEDPVAGQTTKTLTAGESGTYVCKVTLANGEVLTSDKVEYTPSVHIHDYTYTANDDVITESCSCGHSETATIAAPTGTLVYNGTPVQETVIYSDGWKGGALIVTYTDKDDTALTGAPVNAGIYTACFSVPEEDCAVSMDITIEKAQVTVTADDKQARVRDRMPELTYQIAGLMVNDSLTTAPTLTTDANMNRAGTYDIIPDGADAGSNYTITYVNGTLTVKAPTVTPVHGGGGVTIEMPAPVGAVMDCPRDHTCPMYPFTDLDRHAWYHDGVHFCIENDLMGSTDTAEPIFEPNLTTTRAMIVTILWRLEGEPVVNDRMDFEDVAQDRWYTEAIRWAASEKIVEGYGNGKFGPNDVITREQLVTIMWRYAKYDGCDVSVGENTNILSYDDAFDVADWAMPAMQWACGTDLIEGIARGNEMNLEPQSHATRAQVATILYRFCENVANED